MEELQTIENRIFEIELELDSLDPMNVKEYQTICSLTDELEQVVASLAIVAEVPITPQKPSCLASVLPFQAQQ